MSIFDPNSGFTGTPDPLRFAWGQQAIEDARGAAQGASLDLWPAADFLFIDPLTGDPQLPQAIEDVAAVIRASGACSDGWSGVNGDPAGFLIEHASGKASWAPSGLTVAPAIENIIANPRGVGAASWGWGGGGATVANVGSGSDDGWPYVEMSINGTSVGGYLYFGGASVASGDPMAGHLGFRLASGTLPAGQLLYIEREGSIVGAPIPVTPDALHRRWGGLRTAPGAGSATSLTWVLAAGVYSNTVVRLYAPMLSKTTWMPRVVLPAAGATGASVRAMESVSLSPDDWYRHDRGTLVVEFTGPQIFGPGIASLHEGDFHGRSVFTLPGDLLGFSSSKTGMSTYHVAPLTAGRHIAALRWTGRVHRAVLDGQVVETWTTTDDVNPPEALHLGTGGLFSGLTGRSAAPLHRVRFFPRALTDAEMIDVTSPFWSA